jgi:hypothetical protein
MSAVVWFSDFATECGLIIEFVWGYFSLERIDKNVYKLNEIKEDGRK